MKDEKFLSSFSFPVSKGAFRTLILFLLLTSAAQADTLKDRRAMWAKILDDQSWQFFEGQLVESDSPAAKVVALNQEALDTLFSNIAYGRFDGEKAEAQTFLLIYFDCKVGHKELEAQLNRQNRHIRSEVSKELLRLQEGSSNELVSYLKRI